MKRMPIDGILLVGDNFYPCGVTSVEIRSGRRSRNTSVRLTCRSTRSSAITITAISSSAAGRTTGRAAIRIRQAEVKATGKVAKWEMPARNYMLHSRLADFAMIDTQPLALDFPKGYAGSLGADGEKAWIAGALPHMHAHWHIVVGHHTIFSSGMHGRTNNATQTRVRELLPLLRENHVDLYICGHDHDMELLGELQRGPKSDPLFLVSGAGSGTDEMRPRRATVKEPPTIYPRSRRRR